MTATPFEANLRAELLAGIERHERRRRRRRAAARVGGMALGVVAVVAVVLGLLPGSIDPEPAESEPLRIMRADDAMVITVADLEADPEAIRRQLREAGLGALKIVEVPTAPSQVGRFLGVGGVSEGFEILNGDGPIFTSFLITPAAAEGTSLQLGREARPGESYARPVDAFGPQGPLHCSGLWGARVGDALDDIERLGIDARFDTTTAASDVDPHEILDHRIGMAMLIGPKRVLFMTAPGPVEELMAVEPPDTSDCPSPASSSSRP